MLKDIMTACIILHNMIIEDERHIDEVERGDYEQFNATTLIQCHTLLHLNLWTLFDIIIKETHSQLQSDLVEHLWQLHSNS
jgi:hypothetical protein